MVECTHISGIMKIFQVNIALNFFNHFKLFFVLCDWLLLFLQFKITQKIVIAHGKYKLFCVQISLNNTTDDKVYNYPN